jgi:hypothetical protein
MRLTKCSCYKRAIDKFLNCFTIILFRTSLSGVDLNRRWDNPNKQNHPTIHNCKMMCKRFQKARDIILSCDIHGHSRKEGLFMYGCHITKFPDLFDVQCQFFSKAKCTFRVEVRKKKNMCSLLHLTMSTSNIRLEHLKTI